MVRYLNIAVAINRLLPVEGKLTTINHSWDFGSIATLTRTFIETFHSFYYIGIDLIDDNEWKLRLKVFHLHDCSHRKELFKLMGESKDNLIEFEEMENQLLADIQTNPKFFELSKDVRSRILKKQTAFILSRREMEKRIDNEDTSISWIYKFLSVQTHSFPMSFYRTEPDGRGSGVENEADKEYIKLCLSWVTEYLKKGNDYISKLKF